MRKVLFTILCLLFMFNINEVNASSCDNDDIERLRELARNVTYNAEYIGDTDEDVSIQTYNVSFVGITDELYVANVYGGMRVDSDSQVIQLQSGTTTLEVYSRNCNNKRLKTITIELLKYNIYSIYSECDNIPDEKLDVCNPWYQGNITYESFEKDIDNYNLEKKIELEEKDKTFFDKVYDFFISYYYIVVPIILILSISFILLIIKRYRKNILD